MKTLKTFTATHLNKHAQEVFAAAKDDGGAMIKHDHFKSGRFIITWEKSYAGHAKELHQVQHQRHL